VGWHIFAIGGAELELLGRQVSLEYGCVENWQGMSERVTRVAYGYLSLPAQVRSSSDNIFSERSSTFRIDNRTFLYTELCLKKSSRRAAYA
jgi:hypothetical protein